MAVALSLQSGLSSSGPIRSANSAAWASGPRRSKHDQSGVARRNHHIAIQYRHITHPARKTLPVEHARKVLPVDLDRPGGVAEVIDGQTTARAVQ